MALSALEGERTLTMEMPSEIAVQKINLAEKKIFLKTDAKNTHKPDLSTLDSSR